MLEGLRCGTRSRYGHDVCDFASFLHVTELDVIKAMYVGQCHAYLEYRLLISRNVEIEDKCSSFQESPPPLALGSKFYDRVIN
jgi:hypothetical protein